MTNTVDEMRAKILFDVIKEPCGMDTILSTDNCKAFQRAGGERRDDYYNDHSRPQHDRYS